MSLFRLFYIADFFSQILVILLISVGFFVVACSIYVIIKLQFKRREINRSLDKMTNLKDFKSEYFFNILMHCASKDVLNEDLLYALINKYIQKEIKIKLFLGIAATTGPLLGLLGTIWGVMNVFLSIQISFDIKTIAPGIAEALVTTIAGLFVAIPAAIMYHEVSFLIKSYMREIELFCLYYEKIENEKKK